MIDILRRKELPFHSDSFESIDLKGKNLAIIDLSMQGRRSGGKELLQEHILSNGGVLRQSPTRDIDCVILITVGNVNVIQSYKKQRDCLARAIELRNRGNQFLLISDLDYFCYFNLFSKLRMENKLRLSRYYLKSPERFNEKTAKKIEQFIEKQKSTYKYKDFFNDCKTDINDTASLMSAEELYDMLNKAANN